MTMSSPLRPLGVLLALLGLFLAIPARAAVTGEQRTAVILVNYQDDASQPITREAAHALVFGSVSDFYWETSYQTMFLSGDTLGWYTLPISKNTCDPNAVAREADLAVAASGVDLSRYDRLVYLGAQNACSVTGYNSGVALPSRTWLFTNLFNARIVAHEMGHNFGLSHSQALDCGAAILGDQCTNISYGDAADTMGGGSTPHFNAFQKQLLGWLGTAGTPALTTATASGRYRIEPMSTQTMGVKAIRVPRGLDAASGQMSYYYVEYRQPVGFDAVLSGVGDLANGVLVHTGGQNQYSMLLDMQPDSDTGSWVADVRDSALQVGRSFVDQVAGVTLTLVSADATGASVDVTIGGGAPACVRAAPDVAVSPSTATVAAGSSDTRTVTVTNRDSAACNATTFALASQLPTGWTGGLATASMSLSPGGSASTTLSAAVPANATAGEYAAGIGTSSTNTATHTRGVSTTFSVQSASTAALAVALGTDKTSYLRGQTVYMSALVRADGVIAPGTAVQFRVQAPNGAVTTVSATSGSDGYARGSYRIAKAKNAAGSYALTAVAGAGGGTATATAVFTAR